MRYGTIIIGGGLSAITAGIALARRGRRVAVIAAGQPSARFNNGAFHLLGRFDGQPVESPLDAISSLAGQHPYRLIGQENVEKFAAQAAAILRTAGVNIVGSHKRNVNAYSPLGLPEPAWLVRETVLSDHAPLPSRLALLHIKGFIDSPLPMVAYHLGQNGFQVDTLEIDTPDIAAARRTAAGMRTLALARTLGGHKALAALHAKIREVADPLPQSVLLVLPALIGIDNSYTAQLFRDNLGRPLAFLPSPPPSVLGLRLTTELRHYFQMLGGLYRTNQRVTTAHTANGRVAYITTDARPGMHLEADNYILATGTLASGGLVTRDGAVAEPLFNLDLTPDGRVTVDNNLHPSQQGQTIDNLYAIGDILARDPRAGADREGVAMLTALHAARQIRP